MTFEECLLGNDILKEHPMAQEDFLTRGQRNLDASLNIDDFQVYYAQQKQVDPTFPDFPSEEDCARFYSDPAYWGLDDGDVDGGNF